MMKIALAGAAAAAVLATAPLVSPIEAQGVQMAQVDMRTGLHLDDRDPSYDRQQRRGCSSDATVGVGPGAKLTTGRSAGRRLPTGVRKSRP
jgi:hypothetical protein